MFGKFEDGQRFQNKTIPFFTVKTQKRKKERG
jgi:hypothetical protein